MTPFADYQLIFFKSWSDSAVYRVILCRVVFVHLTRYTLITAQLICQDKNIYIHIFMYVVSSPPDCPFGLWVDKDSL